MPANPSSPSWSAPLFSDGDFTVATACGLPVLSSPLPSINASAPVSPSTPNSIISSVSYNTECTLTQQFVQYRTYFTPLALNTKHPDFSSLNGTYTGPNFYLVAESERQDAGGGIVKWTRTYAIVPPSWDDWETYQYAFPGLAGYTLSGPGVNVPGRSRVNELVSSRVRHDYFLVDPSLGSDSYPVYATPGNIPKIWAMQYCAQFYYSGAWYGSSYLAVNTLSTSSPASLPSYGTSAGLAVTTSNYASNLGNSTTMPCYEAMVVDANYNGWKSGITKIVILSGVTGAYTSPGAIDMSNSVFGGQIPAEDSRLTRWQGNIYQRVCRYVLCQ